MGFVVSWQRGEIPDGRKHVGSGENQGVRAAHITRLRLRCRCLLTYYSCPNVFFTSDYLTLGSDKFYKIKIAKQNIYFKKKHVEILKKLCVR